MKRVTLRARLTEVAQMIVRPVANWEGSLIELAPGEEREVRWTPQQYVYFGRVLFGHIHGDDPEPIPLAVRSVQVGNMELPVHVTDATENGDCRCICADDLVRLHPGEHLTFRFANMHTTKTLRFRTTLLVQVPGSAP